MGAHILAKVVTEKIATLDTRCRLCFEQPDGRPRSGERSHGEDSYG
jgi:hypothetical protein